MSSTTAEPPPLMYIAMNEKENRYEAYLTRLPYAVRDAIRIAMEDRLDRAEFTDEGQILSPSLVLDEPYQQHDMFIQINDKTCVIKKLVIMFTKGALDEVRIKMSNVTGSVRFGDKNELIWLKPRSEAGVDVERGRSMHNISLMFFQRALADVFDREDFKRYGVKTEYIRESARKLKNLYQVDKIVRAGFSRKRKVADTESQMKNLNVEWSDNKTE